MKDIFKIDNIQVIQGVNEIILENNIRLDMTQMGAISRIYRTLCTSEFIYENYNEVNPSNRWEIASKIRELVDEQEITENEAIIEVLGH